MTAIVLDQPGALTSLQDGGRVGHARHGVPRSGPVDPLAHRMAARCSGVPVDEVSSTVGIEVGPQPMTMHVEGGTVAVALAGSGAELAVAGSSVSAPCVVDLPPDVPVTVRARTWAYLVPAAAVDVQPVLGSRSHHPRSGLGPSLVAGSRLGLGAPRAVRVGRRQAPRLPGGPELTLLPAPQTQLFTAPARSALVQSSFSTTTAFDRMAHRLDGPALEADGGHDIVSDGIVAGALQVPGDGRPWVLTADHQTTGGYPKIAVLTTVGLARFVRLPPGTSLRFAWGDPDTARAQLRDAHEEVERVVAGRITPTELQLGRANLIDGVVDGT